MTALPDVAFRKLTAVIGTPGAGKSYNVCEQIVVPKLKRREQVVIIDPTGAWFGVTLKPDGKTRSGYDIAVFGGDHGMQLTPNMGRAMGELLGTQALSAVLDLSRMELSEQISFMAEWAGTILLHNKKPITIVIDEADEFCPQVSQRAVAPAEGVTRPQQKVLDALAWWAALGHHEPTHVQIASAASYAVGGNFNNLCSSIVAAGYAERRQPGTMSLTPDGESAAVVQEAPTSASEVQGRVSSTLKAPQQKVFAALLETYPDELTAEDLATRSGYSVGGNFNNIVSSLTSREIVTRPRPGMILAADWLFEVR